MLNEKLALQQQETKETKKVMDPKVQVDCLSDCASHYVLCTPPLYTAYVLFLKSVVAEGPFPWVENEPK